MSKPVTLDGIVYPSQRAAAAALGVTPQRIWQIVHTEIDAARRAAYRDTNRERLRGYARRYAAERYEASNGTPTYHHGEDHVSHKLTWADVAEIRKRHAQGETLTELSVIFPVSVSRLSKIVRGLAWKSNAR